MCDSGGVLNLLGGVLDAGAELGAGIRGREISRSFKKKSRGAPVIGVGALRFLRREGGDGSKDEWLEQTVWG